MGWVDGIYSLDPFMLLLCCPLFYFINVYQPIMSLANPPTIPLQKETRTQTQTQNQIQTDSQNRAIADYYRMTPATLNAPPPARPAELYSTATTGVAAYTPTHTPTPTDYYMVAPISFVEPPPNTHLNSVSTRDVTRGAGTVIQDAPSPDPVAATAEGFCGAKVEPSQRGSDTNTVRQYAQINDTDFIVLDGKPGDLSKFSSLFYQPSNKKDDDSPRRASAATAAAPPRCTKGDEILFKFYMGSISVVGLYVLYRLM